MDSHTTSVAAVPPPSGPVRRYTQLLGEHTAFYALTAVSTFGFGVINVAILTRYLSPAKYGASSLYLFTAAALTTLYSLGVAHGTLGVVFGPTGEHGEVNESGETLFDRPRAFGTGLVMITVTSIAGAALVWIFATPIAGLVVGKANANTTTLVLCAVAGAIATVWRLSINSLRFERRPAAYAAIFSLRPFFVLVGQTAFLLYRPTVRSAVDGVIVANVASLAATMWATRRLWRLSFRWKYAVAIMRYGAALAPVSIYLWSVQTVDLFMLGQYVSLKQVGLYSFAVSIATIAAYLVGAFSTAWGPLRQSTAWTAAERDAGRARLEGYLMLYFLIALALLLVALWDGAGVLALIGPKTYRQAAHYVPVAALPYALQGVYLLIYRMTDIPHKRRALVGVALVGMPVFIGLSVVMIPAWGPYGASLAPATTLALSCVVMYVIAARGGTEMDYDWPRMIAAIGLAVAFGYGGHEAATTLPMPWSLTVVVASYLTLIATFIATGIVRRAHIRPLLAMVRALPMLRIRRRPRRAAPALNPETARLVRAGVCEGVSPAELARIDGSSEEVALKRLVAGLRQIAGLPAAETSLDPSIGRLMMYRGAVADWDERARALWPQGASPLEVDVLASTCRDLRRTKLI